jgi:hypothetical protein
MADAKFNIEIGYSSNKQEFDKLIQNLETVKAYVKEERTAKGESGLTKELREAEKAAKRLQEILTKS